MRGIEKLTICQHDNQGCIKYILEPPAYHVRKSAQVKPDESSYLTKSNT